MTMAAVEPTNAVPLGKSLRCLLRVEYLPFSALMPAVGVATSGASPSGSTWAWLALATLAFHLWSMWINDVIDLPVDRQQPGRRSYPLVRGVIAPGTLLAAAACQLPLMAVALWAAQAGPMAWAAAAVAMGIMLVYNLHSKTSPVPPLMDLAQAVPFGAMVVLGAAVADPSGPPGMLTWAAALWLTSWETLTNVFGGLRDLEFDARMGLRTTPRLLGARVVYGQVVLPAPLRSALVGGQLVQALCTGLLFALAAPSWPAVAFTSAALFHVVAAGVLRGVPVAAEQGCRSMTRVVVVHLGLSLLPVAALLVHLPTGPLVALLVAAFVLPTLRFYGDALRSLSPRTLL
jgi:4-hydroxybenzoate polyprenyltransferase